MQAHNDNSSEEDLSKYKKRGYDLKTLEELHATTKVTFDPASTLYGPLVSPALNYIEGYKLYVRSAEDDLAKITFQTGPHAVVQDIKRDREALTTLYPDYEASCIAVSKLPASSPSWENNWRVHEEGIVISYPMESPLSIKSEVRHRQIAARLHPKQKTVRVHFESTYPKLLDDHIECMEQVKKLVKLHANRRSELSTTIACNANAEKDLLDRFSLADAIAVPHLKMELERDRREHRHAPILNLFTREMDDGCTVILGRDIELGSETDDDLARELRGAVAPHWKKYWDIIHAMESDETQRFMCRAILNLQHRQDHERLIRVIMYSTRMTHPLLNIIDEHSLNDLNENPWNRLALITVMKDVDPGIRRILKACSITYITTSASIYVIRYILRTKNGSLSFNPSMQQSTAIVLTMWDCDLWRPLPDDVEWKTAKRNGHWRVCRMKRLRAKADYFVDGQDSDWVHLQVDEDGNIMDTPENQEKKRHIEERETKSRIVKLFEKLSA
ncbi:hypothetical protein FRC17_002054 [Serendipita sp. 399]|nr:hypothetical protein FRC17_002054 [Serendipita sp. 399]